MKKIAIILVIVGLSQVAPAQNKFKELVARIALLKVYLGYLQKGYSTVSGGLDLIGDIKGGEFWLHKDYFNSLGNVNPRIKHYAKVADIITLQIMINHQYKKAYRQAKEHGLFNPDELNYIKAVYDNLLKETAKDVELLIAVATSGQLQMTDAQRLEQVEKVYMRVQEQYGFMGVFNNESKIQSLGRLKLARDINAVKMFYKVK